MLGNEAARGARQGKARGKTPEADARGHPELSRQTWAKAGGRAGMKGEAGCVRSRGQAMPLVILYLVALLAFIPQARFGNLCGG